MHDGVPWGAFLELSRIVTDSPAHGFRGDDLVKANTARVKWFEKYLVGNTGE